MQQSSMVSTLAGITERPTRPARQSREFRVVAGSKSLAAMLPTILTTGVVSLVATAVMRLLWMGWSHDFIGAWMEAWLTVWPIAFPFAYISKPLINKLMRHLSTSLHAEAAFGVAAVMQASEQATSKSGLKRLKHKPALLLVQH